MRLIYEANTIKEAIMTDQQGGTVLGGVRDVDPNANDLQVESLARFAVDEHNKKENVSLEYRRLIGAKTQVVAGTMHHLTVEVADGEKKKVYEAKVLEKAWENLKKLESFNHLHDV